jgi:hypothetical protein
LEASGEHDAQAPALLAPKRHSFMAAVRTSPPNPRPRPVEPDHSHRSSCHQSSMAADATEAEPPRTPSRERKQLEKVDSNGKESAAADSDSDDDDEEETEPVLKYSRLTSNLLPLYRNGDATSTFMVAGDKMVPPWLPAVTLETTC